MNTLTLTIDRRSLVAIVRTADGGAFAVAPADWPTPDEIDAIIRLNNCAAGIRALMDPADYKRYRQMCKRSNV